MEMSKRRLRNSLDYVNKEGIPYVLILGEGELTEGKIKLKDMEKGTEEYVSLESLEDVIENYI
jgi:histidyl-tRNA synthetase